MNYSLDKLIRDLLEAFDIHQNAPLGLLQDKLIDGLQNQAQVDAIMAIYNLVLRASQKQKADVKKESVNTPAVMPNAESYAQFVERVIKGN